jgi:hypothetical protein
MQSIESNLGLMEIMLDEFEAYLLSAVVYWPLSTKDKSKRTIPLPRLTLGGLSLILDELASQVSEMNMDQERQYLRLMRIFKRFTVKWQVNIENKAQQELNSRLNLWQGYLKDLEDDPEQIEEYSHEVRIRVMISHLVDLSGSSNEVDEKIKILSHLDRRIEYFVEVNTFLWDEQLKPVYPESNFPYLYRKPRNSPNK